MAPAIGRGALNGSALNGSALNGPTLIRGMLIGGMLIGGMLGCETASSSSTDAQATSSGRAGKGALGSRVAATGTSAALQNKAGPVQPLDAKNLERIVGRTVSKAAEGVLRVTQPRTEVKLTVDGYPFSPAAGLTSWAAFQPVSEGAMVMGDTVVFQDEVDGVIDAAFAHGLHVTALHNHFFYDEPKAYFLHIGGRGKLSVLASGVQSMWASIRSRREQSPQPAKRFGGDPVVPGKLDAKSLAKIIGVRPKASPGVVKFSLPRRASMGGNEFGGALGLSSWVSFSGNDLNASIDGDFAMTEKEVQPVLRALRRRGIHIVALHNHMVGGDPFYYFTHFWATGPALQLALAFRVALEEQVKIAGTEAIYGKPEK